MSAAIYELPDEILTLVFETYVLDLDCSPWDLTCISKRLRVVAFSSRQIWTRLQIEHGFVPSAVAWSGKKKSHLVCRNASDLRMVLDQSISAPLDIIIAEMDMDMAIELAKEQARWRSIKFDECFTDSDPVRGSAVFQWLFSHASAPIQLEKVAFDGFDTKDYIQRWLNTIQPRSLELEYPDSLASLLDIEWSKRLRRLKVVRIWTSIEETYLQQIINATAFQLTHLSFWRVESASSTIFETPIEFPNLVEFYAVGIRVWWNFAMPKLRKFSLYPRGSPPDAIIPTYPQLNELNYASNLGLVGCSLSAAALKTLRLERVLSGEYFDRIFAPGLLSSHIKVLHIQKGTFPDTSLLDALRFLCHIEELRLSVVKFSADFISQLEWTGAATVCPRLRRLICDLRGFKEMMPSEFNPVFQSLADSRRLGEVCLDVLQVLWPKPWDGSPVDFV